MKISVIGSGYVGVVSGACLAELGNDVLCLDVDPKKIAILNNGNIKANADEFELVENLCVTKSKARSLLYQAALRNGKPLTEDFVDMEWRVRPKC